MKQATKNSIIFAVMVLLFILMMTGCGTQTERDSSIGSQPASPSTEPARGSQEEVAADSASQTKSFNDANGTQEIPIKPKHRKILDNRLFSELYRKQSI